MSKADNILVGEYELFNAPIRGLRKTLKNSRKYVVKELAEFDKKLYTAWDNRSNTTSPNDIDELINSLKQMKQTLHKFENISNHELQLVDHRIQHFKIRNSQNNINPKSNNEWYPRWNDLEINTYNRTSFNSARTSKISNSYTRSLSKQQQQQQQPFTSSNLFNANVSLKHSNRSNIKSQLRTPRSMVYPHSPSFESVSINPTTLSPTVSSSNNNNKYQILNNNRTSQVLHSVSFNNNNNNNNGSNMDIDDIKYEYETKDDNNNNSNNGNNNNRIIYKDVKKEDKLSRCYGYIETDDLSVDLVKRNWLSMFSDRLIVDYLLRNLCFETSKRLLITTDLGLLTSFDVFHHSKNIFISLEKRNILELIKWCRKNKTLLKESNSNLEYLLKCRYSIFILKNKGKMDAYNYIKHQISSDKELNVNENKFKEKTSLLTYIMLYNKSKSNKKNDKINYSKLIKLIMDENKIWNEIEKEFWKSYLSIHGLSSYSLLEKSLNMGLSIIKSYYCEHSIWCNDNCPTCRFNIKSKCNILSTNIRPIKINISFLVCPITKKICTNNLYLTPYGFVVSKEGLNILIKTGKLKSDVKCKQVKFL